MLLHSTPPVPGQNPGHHPPDLPIPPELDPPPDDPLPPSPDEDSNPHPVMRHSGGAAAQALGPG